jgi:hypothetical protein
VEWDLEQGDWDENAYFLLSIIGILNTIGVVSYWQEIESSQHPELFFSRSSWSDPTHNKAHCIGLLNNV